MLEENKFARKVCHNVCGVDPNSVKLTDKEVEDVIIKSLKEYSEEFAYNQELEFINDSDDHLSLKDNNNLDIYYGIILKLNDKFEIWCNGMTYRECRDCTSMEFYMISNEILSINDFVDWFEKLEIDF